MPCLLVYPWDIYRDIAAAKTLIHVEDVFGTLSEMHAYWSFKIEWIGSQRFDIIR
jgi:hypothetical protein